MTGYPKTVRVNASISQYIQYRRDMTQGERRLQRDEGAPHVPAGREPVCVCGGGEGEAEGSEQRLCQQSQGKGERAGCRELRQQAVNRRKKQGESRGRGSR